MIYRPILTDSVRLQFADKTARAAKYWAEVTTVAQAQTKKRKAASQKMAENKPKRQKPPQLSPQDQQRKQQAKKLTVQQNISPLPQPAAQPQLSTATRPIAHPLPHPTTRRRPNQQAGHPDWLTNRKLKPLACLTPFPDLVISLYFLFFKNKNIQGTPSTPSTPFSKVEAR